MKCITFGFDKIVQSEFKDVKNMPLLDGELVEPKVFIMKPAWNTGLYTCELKFNKFGSPSSDWKRWCIIEGYRVERLKEHVIFELKEDSKIFTLVNEEDFDTFIEKYQRVENDNVFIDWEGMSHDYDAFNITENGIYVLDMYSLIKWDVPQIVLFNLDCIK